MLALHELQQLLLHFDLTHLQMIYELLHSLSILSSLSSKSTMGLCTISDSIVPMSYQPTMCYLVQYNQLTK